MNINNVVENIRSHYAKGSLSWLADDMNGETIVVEPSNYDYWFTTDNVAVYTRRDYVGCLGHEEYEDIDV